MPNSKNENQDKNLENEDLKMEKTEGKPKKAAEKTTQNKKTASQAEKKNTATADKRTADNESTSADKKPVQKKSAAADKKPAQEKSVAADKKPAQEKSAAADKKPAQKKSTAADKKPAQKKSTAADKKPAQKKETVTQAAEEKPKQAAEKKAAKPQEAKKAQAEKEIKETVMPEEAEIESGEVTQEDILVELFSDKDNEAINDELENIKNIIQEDVYKIIEDSNGEEWSEIVKQSRETKNEDKAEDDEELPEEKHEEQTKFNYLSYFAVALFAIALISIVYLTVLNWKPMSYIIKADNFDSSHKLTSAVTQYENAAAEVKNNDGKVTKRLISREIKDYYKLGLDNYSVNSSLINKYYTSKDLKCFLNRDISKINDEYALFNNTANECYTVFSSVKNYDEYVKQVDNAYKKSPAKYDKSFMAFFKYQAADYFEEDTKTQIKDLKLAESEATSATVLNLYYDFLARIYVKTENYDKVFDYTQKMLDINQEDMTAYSLNTMAYRLQKNYTKALEECYKGLKISNKDSGLNQQMAIILILQGKYSTAEYYASIAYKNSSSQDAYYSSSNVYALCAYLNKDETAYEEIKSGTTIDDTIASIINGSKTIKEVFLDKEGAY